MRLKGGRELSQFLDAFPEKLKKGALRAGMVAGARVVRDEARATVAKDTGKVAKAIKTSSPRVNQDGTVSVKVKLKGEHSFIGWFLEYGVSPHLITAGDADLTAKTLNKHARNNEKQGGGGISTQENGLIRVGGYKYNSGPKGKRTDADMEASALVIGPTIIRDAVLHPGFAAKPFLRPALDRKAAEAVNAVGERIREYLKTKTGFTAPVTIEADIDDE
jgi:HK97 gp10 family phage protein